MDKLEKSVKSTLKAAFEDLLMPKALQEDVRKVYKCEIPTEECEKVRKAAIEELHSKIGQQSNQLFHEYDLPNLFDAMKDTVKNQRNNANDGWRWTDDPVRDSYAKRRIEMDRYAKKLEEYKSQLEKQYQTSLSNYNGLKDEITQEMNKNP